MMGLVGLRRSLVNFSIEGVVESPYSFCHATN